MFIILKRKPCHMNKEIRLAVVFFETQLATIPLSRYGYSDQQHITAKS